MSWLTAIGFGFTVGGILIVGISLFAPMESEGPPPMVAPPVSVTAETGSGANTLEPETTAHRMLRTYKEWVTLNNRARDEKTPLRLAADAKFLEYFEAQKQLEKEESQ